MIKNLRMKLAALINGVRRKRGPTLQDQIAKVIMHTCTLQLERGESKLLAPTKGATGPMTLSGGAITTITYTVFDRNADKLDQSIKSEPWRAFSSITMRLSIDRDPEFQVQTDGKDVEPNDTHKAPGLALVKNLSNYFPLIPKQYTGPVYKPEVQS